MVVDDLKPATVVPIFEENIANEARLVTDEPSHEYHLRDSFVEHNVIRHGGKLPWTGPGPESRGSAVCC